MALTHEDAVRLALHAQGLLKPQDQEPTKEAVLNLIRQLGVLQIDTIHIVARSHNIVLWSRLGDHPILWLVDLEAEGNLFEYWAHAACFIPIEDYPLFRRSILDGLRGWKDGTDWLAKHPGVVAEVLERIRTEGPLKSSDFKTDHKPAGGWWNWKDEKVALENLLTAGALMVAKRENFQRVYDLQERIFPGWDDANTPTREAVRRELILRSVERLGIAQPGWVWDYYRLPKRGMAEELAGLCQEGELVETEVEGWNTPAYLHPNTAQKLESIVTTEPQVTTLLSPFDPLVCDRARTKAMFGFEYTIEVYLPTPKRKFGYFSLPILDRGQLIGRLDPKAHRKEKMLEVRNFHLEPGIELDAERAARIGKTLGDFAAWQGLQHVSFGAGVAEQAAERILAGVPEIA
ncbi:MAG: winged helix-turn-helix domain-containing protein [Anaerolineaceae bacterium]|nr:winged helix-turn-helix domain-containing protein [Anaerolineaceae bacterium]